MITGFKCKNILKYAFRAKTRRTACYYHDYYMFVWGPAIIMIITCLSGNRITCLSLDIYFVTEMFPVMNKIVFYGIIIQVYRVINSLSYVFPYAIQRKTYGWVPYPMILEFVIRLLMRIKA